MPFALKPELYRPTTVRYNMSIWIRNGRLLAGCLFNAALFSVFLRRLPPSFSVRTLLMSISAFNGDHPIANRDRVGFGV